MEQLIGPFKFTAEQQAKLGTLLMQQQAIRGHVGSWKTGWGRQAGWRMNVLPTVTISKRPQPSGPDRSCLESTWKWLRGAHRRDAPSRKTTKARSEEPCTVLDKKMTHVTFFCFELISILHNRIVDLK